MRRALAGLLPALLLLALGLAAPWTTGQGNIGNTGVVVLELDSYAKTAGFAANVTYTWGLYNNATFDYSINSTLTVGDPTFRASVYPGPGFLLRRGSFIQVLLNVTTPSSGPSRRAVVNVTLRAFNLTQGSDDQRIFSTSTQAEWPPLGLTIVQSDSYTKQALFGSRTFFAWGIVNPNPTRST